MGVSAIDPGVLQLTGDAITARLQLVFPPARFQHSFIPAKLTTPVWSRLTTKTPFVGVGWNALEGDKEQSRIFDGESTWTVFLCTKNASGHRPRFFGDQQAPGLFSMVHAAVAVLHGWTLDGVGTGFVDRAANAYSDGWDMDDMAIASIEFRMGASLTVGDALTGVDVEPHATIANSWNFGDGTPLAANAPADFASTDTLEPA